MGAPLFAHFAKGGTTDLDPFGFYPKLHRFEVPTLQRTQGWGTLSENGIHEIIIGKGWATRHPSQRHSPQPRNPKPATVGAHAPRVRLDRDPTLDNNS